MSIQKKIALILSITLLLVFGISTLINVRQTMQVLNTSADHEYKALQEATKEQALSVFSSLEVGSQGSLQQGEMDLFASLLQDLGKIPGVLEIGLSNPKNNIDFSNMQSSIGTKLQPDLFSATLKTDEVSLVEADQHMTLLRSQKFAAKCLDCHDGVKPGDLAGVLYVKFSLDTLKAMQTETEEAKSLAQAQVLKTSIGAGVGGLLLAIVIVYVLLGNLIRRPLVVLEEMIESLSKGRLGMRLNLNRKDEIGHIADCMDHFADSLERDVVKNLQELAEGNLDIEVHPYDSQDVVRTAMQKLGAQLNELMSMVHQVSERIALGSAQISDSSQSLSEGATEQASSLEEIHSSMTQMQSQTKMNADNANQANMLTGQVKVSAETGNQHMGNLLVAIRDINEAGNNIQKIIKVIDEIAFQTNLLALNAAVEAARAGQHGKGFAVVAEEVRNLAARSARAAQETADLIAGSVNKTEAGTQIAQQTASALESMVGEVTKVSDLVSEIAAASSEQAQGIAQINTGLGQIDNVTQQNTAKAEEEAAAAQDLSSQADQLRELLSRFRVRNTARPQSGRAPQRRPQPQLGGWAALENQPSASDEDLSIDLDDGDFGRY